MSEELKLTLASAASPTVSGLSPALSAVPPSTVSRIPHWISLTGSLLFLGQLPLLVIYGMGLMTREPYQFAPLAVAGAVFLLWDRLRLLPEHVVPGSPRIALGLLTVALGIQCVATVKWSPWLAVIATLLTALGVVWALGGFSLAKSLFPAALMLIVLLRPPLGLDTKFTLALRGLAVRLSSCLLDHFGVPHFLSGNVVEIANQRFFVEEACSGINSVLFVGAFSLFYTLWRHRPWWHVLFVLLAAISFVLLGNVFRITAGVMLSYHYDIDVLSGWRHETFGLLLIVAYVAMAMSADSFLSFLTLKGEAARRRPVAITPGMVGQSVHIVRKLGSQLALSVGPLTPHLALAMGVGFSLLALGQTGWAFVRQSQKPSAMVSHLRGGAKFTVPDQIGEWKRVDRKQRNVSYLELRAVYSEVWTFQNGRITAFVALDYPYEGLHDLTLCYFNQGWNVNVGAKNVKASSAAGGRQDYFDVGMTKKRLSYGYLLFGGFTEDGEWAGQDFNTLIQRRFSGRLPVTYQVQVLASTYTPLSTAEKQQLLQLFQATRQLLSKQVLAQLNQPR